MKKSTLPNSFTFMNLSCGILSLLATTNDKFLISALFILLGALIDRYDGRIARKFNLSSEIGKELDSLADLVSFGVAPSMLSYFVFNTKQTAFFSILWLFVLILYPICGAYRLAKYNISEFNGVFTGVPITISGSLLAILVIINLHFKLPQLLLISVLFCLSYLMISSFKFKKI